MSTSASKMRNWRVSLRPTTSRATSHSPIAIRNWSASFVRADRPSDRAFTIFSQSSANPIPAEASAVPNTAMLAASRSDRIRYGTPIAVNTIRPPIVGVPAFTWCSAGPSSRMCWPNSRSRRNWMYLGPRKIEISSEASPAIRISPITRVRPSCRRALERLGHTFEADGPRGLHQHDVARLDQAGHQRGCLLGVGQLVRRSAEAQRVVARVLAHRDQHANAGVGRVGTRLAVKPRRLGAE